jgi:hypothetical protein
MPMFVLLLQFLSFLFVISHCYLQYISSFYDFDILPFITLSVSRISVDRCPDDVDLLGETGLP